MEKFYFFLVSEIAILLVVFVSSFDPKKINKQIEEMMGEACKTLSEKLHDGVYLFRDMVTKG